MNADLAFQPIPLAKISPSPSNPRKHFDETELAELAESIKTKGLLQPILVRPCRPAEKTDLRELDMPARSTKTLINVLDGTGLDTIEDLIARVDSEGGARTLALGKLGLDRVLAMETMAALAAFEQTCLDRLGYELVVGERRLRAVKLLSGKTIPAIVRTLTDREVLEVQVIENEQRADVTPLEKADGYAALVEQHGATVEEIAERVGKSVSTIRNLLKLRALPSVARKALDDGAISVSVAQLVARVPGEKERTEAAKLATERDWNKELPSYRRVKEEIEDRFMVELKQAPFGQADKTLLPEAGSCKACPKRAGNARDLYPDCRADICTDPACYRRKVEAHQRREEEAARAGGKKVLSGDETKKAFRYGQAVQQYGASKWLDLDAIWFAGGDNRTVRERLKGRLDQHQVLAHDEDGKAYWLVPRKMAREIIEADLRERKAAEKADKHVPRAPSDYAVEQRARGLALAEIGATAAANFEDLDGLAANGGPETNAAYQALQLVAWYTAINELADQYGDAIELCPLSRRIPGIFELSDGDEEQRQVKAWMERASPRALLAYLLETIAKYTTDSFDRTVKPVGEAILLDFTNAGSIKAFQKQARQQLHAEIKAKANGKPKKAETNGHAAPAAADEAWRNVTLTDLNLAPKTTKFFRGKKVLCAGEVADWLAANPDTGTDFGGRLRREIVEAIERLKQSDKATPPATDDAPWRSTGLDLVELLDLSDVNDLSRQGIATLGQLADELTLTHTLGIAQKRVKKLLAHIEVLRSKAHKPSAAEAVAKRAKARKCRECGCTEADCRQCIEKTGAPCVWVEEDLCSACEEVMPGHE